MILVNKKKENLILKKMKMNYKFINNKRFKKIIH